MRLINNKIVAYFKDKITDNIIITGGHFLVNDDYLSQINEGTIASFQAAAILYKKAKKMGFKVGLGILLNDIGMVCGGSSHCSINAPRALNRSSFILPYTFKEVLKEFEISENEVEIFWEKHIRNRGKKLFHKVKDTRHDLQTIEGDYYLEDKEGYGNIMLLRKMKTDKYGTPACPLIMAAYAFEQQRKNYCKSLNIYYIDQDNLSNIPNHLVIEKGRLLAKKLGITIEIQNVYFTKNEILTNLV